MHATLFAIKRVHLRALAITRPLVIDYSLTPARFDLMRVVLLHDEAGQGIQQSTLRWLLGVTAPTVSRMLKSLEKLNLVRRERDARDRRCLMVYLTPGGRCAVRMGLWETVVSGEDRRTVARGVLGDTRVESDTPQETERTVAAARDRVRALDELLVNMRKAFADPAPFYHPWRLGPFVPLVFTTFVDGRCRYDDHHAIEEPPPPPN